MKILIKNNENKKWDVLDSAEYTAEAELQKLLAESPSLISISEIREGVPPLTTAIREFGLPGSGSTDIIAFNPRGDIVIVECKLAANPEIKRKVIAQVLEYGAYLWNMSYDDLNQLVFQRKNKNLADLVAEDAGDPDWDEESFRSTIQDNLSRGAFILVIAVDEINDELSRTIRFLNACGKPEFAFTALEMRRFHKTGTEILVPHLFGEGKTSGPEGPKRKQWTEKEFFEAAQSAVSPEIAAILLDLYNWTKRNADRIWFGVGSSKGSYTFHYLLNGKSVSVFSVYTNGILTINFGWMKSILSVSSLDAFHQEITSIPSLKNIPADYTRWPSVKIVEAFSSPENLQMFKAAVKELGKVVHE
jgi:hypothetical protein